jgi:hypothetical protein
VSVEAGSCREESRFSCTLGVKSQSSRKDSSKGDRRVTTNIRDAAERTAAHQPVAFASVTSDFVFASMKRASQRAQRYGDTRRNA